MMNTGWNMGFGVLRLKLSPKWCTHGPCIRLFFAGKKLKISETDPTYKAKPL